MSEVEELKNVTVKATEKKAGNAKAGGKPASEKAEKKARQASISKKKSDMSVKIIQHNQVITKVIRQMAEALAECERNSAAFNGQRVLLARAKMQERVLNSALRMMEQNKMQFWMIDDAALENDNK